MELGLFDRLCVANYETTKSFSTLISIDDTLKESEIFRIYSAQMADIMILMIAWYQYFG